MHHQNLNDQRKLIKSLSHARLQGTQNLNKTAGTNVSISSQAGKTGSRWHLSDMRVYTLINHCVSLDHNATMLVCFPAASQLTSLVYELNRYSTLKKKKPTLTINLNRHISDSQSRLSFFIRLRGTNFFVDGGYP